jgi:hypothetical protein
LDINDVRATLAVGADLATASQRLGEIIGASGQTPPEKYLQLVEAVGRIVARLRDDLDPTSPPPGIPAQAWATFCGELLAQLIARYVEATRPGILALLLLAGVVDEEDIPTGGVPGRVPYVRRTLNWDRLGTMLSDPGKLAKDLYGWGDSGQPLKFDTLLTRGARALSLAGLPSALVVPSAARLDPYYAPGSPHRASVKELTLTLIDVQDGQGNSLKSTLGVLPIPSATDSAGPPRGIAIAPFVQVSGTPPATGFWPFSIELKGPQAAYGGARLKLLPGSVDLDLGSTADVTVDASARLRRDVPKTLIGSIFSTRLDLEEYSLGLGVRGSLADPDVTIEVAVDRAVLVVDLGEADGFLGRFLGTGIEPIELQVGLVWSSKTGLHVEAGGALEIVIPLNITLGVAKLASLTVRGEAKTDTGVAVTAGLTGSLALGPLAASVENIGARARFVPVSQGKPAGTFGDLDLVFEFKPPDGLGLSVDAAVIKGGGYLYFDHEKGEYAGVLELSIKDQIQVKAIGLLSTKLPGGQRGFSLLLIITAQFPPIQLSFGFVLTGVGGMIGVNRTMVTDVLRAGIRTRTLDSILFPENPVQNAPKIISDLKAVFPPAEGRYVFGPMVEIGWGTPVLVFGRLGVILELPEPVRLVILGQLKLALPRPEAPVVDINLDALGLVEFERQSLSLDATLYDSQVAGFQLLGDMALRLTWAERPNFALSVGGLNPRFQPPPGFPELRRLTLSMGQGENPHLALEAYMAVTSNSVQFGAHLELRAEGGGFAVNGHLGFDCLVILSPFSFIVDIAGSVEVLLGGRSLMSVHLNLLLEGPTPWHAWGEASFKVLFLTITVGFDVRWGDETQVTLPQADARDPLLKALADARNWSPTLPPESERGATLGPGQFPQGAVLVHPFGRLAVRQTVVPLNQQISRFSNSTPPDANEFKVTAASLNQASVTTQATQDYFARGQFFEMSDEERLTRESYERMDSGASLGQATGMKRGHRSELELDYETQLVENPVLPAESLDGPYRPDGDVFAVLLGQGAAALSPVQTTGEAKYVEPGTESPIENQDVRHVIVSTEDLMVHDGLVKAAGVSRAAADLALQRHLADHPEDRERLQVVPTHEAVAA